MKKTILLIASLFLFSGCAQMPTHWQYVQKFPIVRDGNSYVATINGKEMTFIKVSDDFSFFETQNNSGASIDLFQKDNLNFVTVLNRFGVFKTKNKYNKSPGDYILRTTPTKNATQYILVKKGNIKELEYGSIQMHTIHADATAGGWANAYIAYMEPLPHYYDFKSWNPSTLEERKNFVNEFKQRAQKSVQINPGRR